MIASALRSFNSKNIYKKLNNRKNWIFKLLLFIILNLIFSIIYLFIPDYEFGGINTLQTMLENEVLTNKISDILNNKENIDILSEELNTSKLTKNLKDIKKKETFQNIKLPIYNNTNHKLNKLTNNQLSNIDERDKIKNKNIIDNDLSQQLASSVASLYGTSALDFYNKIVNRNIKKKLNSAQYNDLLKIEADRVAQYVTKIRLSENNIYPSIWRKWFDRFYFSIVTGITLGFGDIYPISVKTKLLVILQLFFVYSLIIL